MSIFNTATTPVEKDLEVSDPPTDSISSLAFSSVADYLAVGSWDNNVRSLISCMLVPRGRTQLTTCISLYQVRLYEVGANGQTQGKAMYSHQGPVLGVCWNKVCPLVDLGCKYMT